MAAVGRIGKISVPGNRGRARFRTLAFPGISTGIYGYPAELAAPVAYGTVPATAACLASIEEVIFCCFSADDLGGLRQTACIQRGLIRASLASVRKRFERLEEKAAQAALPAVKFGYNSGLFFITLSTGETTDESARFGRDVAPTHHAA
jgi:hypothetical protein